MLIQYPFTKLILSLSLKMTQMNHSTLEDHVNPVTLPQTDSKPMSLSERFIRNGSNESFDTRRQLN